MQAAMSATNANVASTLERTSRELDTKQKDRDEKQVKSQDKLTTNLERLVKAIQENSISVSGNKAADIGKQASESFDQRSIKDQAKDKLLGRVGADGKRDKFDPNSLRQQMGSVKGIADSLKIVEPDSFFGNLIGRRDDRTKRTDTLTKLNPQMKNLKQFGGDENKVRAYYDKQHKEQFAPAQAKAAGEQYKLDSLMSSGISEQELGATIGGKRQIKARDAASADLLMKDKFKKAEVKELLATQTPAMSKSEGFTASGIGASNVIPFPGSYAGPAASEQPMVSAAAAKETELENIRLMNDQNSVLKAIQENTASMPKLLEAFEIEAKREAKADEQQAQAAANATSGSGIASLAGDLMGGRGKGQPAGKAGKMGSLLKGAGGFLSKAAVPLAAGAAIIGGGAIAYQGMKGANEQEASGEITKSEATVKRGGAIGEGAGTAVGGVAGALKGAAVGAAVGSAIPIVGTAIGGVVGAALGGLGGSFLGGKAGNFLGETGGKIKNYFSGPNPDKSGAENKVKSMSATPSSQGGSKGPQVTQDSYMMIAGEKVADGQPLSDKQMAVMGMSLSSGNTYPPKVMAQYNKQKAEQAKPQTSTPGTADQMSNMSADNQSAKDTLPATNNVQTNVSQTNLQQRNTQAIKPPIRNQDSSYGRMVDRRHAY